MYSTRGNHDNLRVNPQAVIGVQLGETQLAKAYSSGIVIGSDLPLVARLDLRTDSLHVRSTV